MTRIVPRSNDNNRILIIAEIVRDLLLLLIDTDLTDGCLVIW